MEVGHLTPTSKNFDLSNTPLASYVYRYTRRIWYYHGYNDEKHIRSSYIVGFICTPNPTSEKDRNHLDMGKGGARFNGFIP
ncbi:hypothetical protein AMTR_s00166p00058450 [Amborella trichopoda]|uniref:Uncharacterized protein n=1 Tax=Amborella trichopoda TaxID=13333 RepID=W1PS46_AMBTC|nr:hypothetical protein AMTR_s00166p00058450 [Amborella trichopoda]